MVVRVFCILPGCRPVFQIQTRKLELVNPSSSRFVDPFMELFFVCLALSKLGCLCHAMVRCLKRCRTLSLPVLSMCLSKVDPSNSCFFYLQDRRPNGLNWIIPSASPLATIVLIVVLSFPFLNKPKQGRDSGPADAQSKPANVAAQGVCRTDCCCQRCWQCQQCIYKCAISSGLLLWLILYY